VVWVWLEHHDGVADEVVRSAWFGVRPDDLPRSAEAEHLDRLLCEGEPVAALWPLVDGLRVNQQDTARRPDCCFAACTVHHIPMSWTSSSFGAGSVSVRVNELYALDCRAGRAKTWIDRFELVTRVTATSFGPRNATQ
jgi:hypothetical protein